MLINKSYFRPLIIMLVLQSCNLAPDEKIPSLDMPETSSVSINKILPEKWWTIFSSTSLNALEDKALLNNQDIEIALANIEQSKAAAHIVISDRLPSLTANSNTSRSRVSKNSPMYFAGFGLDYITNYTATLSLSYELDLFGKYSMSDKAARSEFLATAAAHDVIVLNITSEVAKLYFTIDLQNKQIDIAKRSLEIAKKIVGHYAAMYENGYCSQKDYLTAEMQAEASERAVEELNIGLQSTKDALALLIGSSPKDIANSAKSLSTINDISIPKLVPSAIPSDILKRRPDIKQAEEILRAANLKIGVAKAAFFPSILLSAVFGADSKKLGDIFSGDSAKWELVGGLTLPIFQAGKLISNTEIATANYKRIVAEYKKVVRIAFKEVIDALISTKNSRKAFAIETSKFQKAVRSYEIAVDSKKVGMISSVEMLNAERAKLSSELELIKAKYNALSAIVDLCKSLGGGWTRRGNPDL